MVKSLPTITHSFIFFICLILFKPAPGVLLGQSAVNVISLAVLALLGLYLCYLYYTAKEMIINEGLSLYNWRSNPVPLYLLLSSLSVIVSTLYGFFVSPIFSSIQDFTELHRYVFYLFFFILAFNIRIDHIKRLLPSVVIMIFIVELFGVMQFFNVFHVNNHIGLFYTISERHYNMIINQQRIPSTFLNPNMYGSFLIIVVALLLGYLTYTNRIKKRFFLPLIILSFISVFLTTSRTAVITVGGMIVYWTLLSLIFKRTNLKRTLRLGIGVAMLYGTIALALIPQISYLDYAAGQIFDNIDESFGKERMFDNEPKFKFKSSFGHLKGSVDSVSSFKNRYDYWRMNVEKFKESPILGHGPMKNGEFVDFADNTYLYILARYGLIGLLIFSVFYAYLFVRTTLAVRSKEVSESRGMVATSINLIIVGYLVMGAVAEVWFNLQSMTLLFTIMGLFYNKHLK